MLLENKQEIATYVRAAYTAFTPYPFEAVSSGYPETWEQLKGYPADGSTVLRVMAGDSDNTIYPTPEDNHVFRAWHDYLHILNDADFGSTGELMVAGIHQVQLREVGAPKWVQDAIWYDTLGQFQYTMITGDFVGNQELFVNDCFGSDLDNVLELVRKGRRY